MATVPGELKYSKTHEWVRVDGEVATIGITDHAQAELGDIVYLDLPEAGRILESESSFGEVESVKAVSELFSPVSGEVVESNTEIADTTEIVNEDPYEQGWLIKVRMSDPSQLSQLMDASDYEKFAEEGGHEDLSYVSNTEEDRKEMLEAIGIGSFEDLLAPIPAAIRFQGDLNLPPTLDEAALIRRLQALAAKNVDLESHLSFLGAGIYDHFRPSVVPALQGRGEFATAYTPYQPEMSQGMLQAIYEYQTLICALTDMDLSNASMYDAATGLAEAALMATSLTNRSEIVVSRAMNPHYRQVIATYASATGYCIIETPYDGMDGDLDSLRQVVGPQTACILFQHPNFFGCLEDIPSVTEIAHASGALSIVSVDPISLGLLKPPGAYEVDIVVGEGQSLGSPMGFGGPLLGFFACNKKFVRSFPGRIVGATVDQQGRRGYTMTLRTREQDIRREKATSNICTNQALIALAATIYLCELGKSGLAQVADLCLQKAHYARKQLANLPGVETHFDSRKFFKEFVIRLPMSPAEMNRRLLEHKIVGGLPLGPYYPELGDRMLVCVTETKTKEDIDLFVEAVRAILKA